MAISPVVLLSFLGLSDAPLEAHLQKEILLQAAYASPLALGSDTTYVEAGGLSASDLLALAPPAADLSVRCLQCQIPNGENAYYELISVNRQENKQQKNGETLNLKLKWNGNSAPDLQSRTTLWKVQVSPSCYVIKSTRSLNSGDIFRSFYGQITNNINNNYSPMHTNCLTPKIASLWSAHTTLRNLDGQETKFNIAQDQVLLEENFQRRKLIKAQSQVNVHFKSPSGLMLKTKGIALGSAALGETLQVEIRPSSFSESKNSLLLPKKVILATARGSYDVQGNLP